MTGLSRTPFAFAAALAATVLLASFSAEGAESPPSAPLKPPPITVLKNGMQDIPFRAQEPAAVIKDYPFLEPLIDEVRKTEVLSTKRADFKDTSTFSTALVKDRDMKANFVFLYIDGPLNCMARQGCAFFAFVDEGQGYKYFTPLFARQPVKVLKDGKDVALIFRGSRGHAKWRFSNHVFHYAGRYIDPSPVFGQAEPLKPTAPMSLPVK